MDLPPTDAVPVQIPNASDRIRLAVDLALVTLHRFLDRGADVTHADVDSCFFDPCIRGVFHRCEEVVVDGVECDCPRRVHDSSIDVDTKVNFHDVLFLQDCLVTGIGGVVCGDMVEVQPRGKADSTFDVVAFLKAWMARQRAHTVLYALSDLREGFARLDELFLRPLPHLSVHFGTIPVVGQEVGIHAVEVTLFFGCGAVGVAANVFDFLADRVAVVGKELGEGDTWRVGLGDCACRGLLLFLLGLPLLFLLLW